MPLSVIAELLGRSVAAPYKSVPRYGLRNWTLAVLRQELTKGATYANELDLERAIRSNAALLAARARVVVDRRAGHRATKLDAKALADVLGLAGGPPDASFLQVWLAVVECMADQLVEAACFGHVEDVSWHRAEQYLDQTVWPRTKGLAGSGAGPSGPAKVCEPYDVPVNLLGGAKRLRRILLGLMSSDPEVVAATRSSWQVQRLVRDRGICAGPEWYSMLDDL